MRSIVQFCVIVCVIVIGPSLAYLLLWPVPIEPFAWTPGENPGASGPFVPNDDLAAAERLALDRTSGPEDVAFDRAGFIYTGVETGAIVRIHPQTGVVTEWARTGGRPLGLAFDGDVLYVADAEQGLLRITRRADQPVVERVARKVEGEPVTFTDGVHVASDGVVWFTAPSTRWPLSKIRYDGMETQPTGRLLRYDPRSGATSVELEGLMFANGVTMSANEDYVLVAEWSGYRLTRLWLAGPRRGERDVFYENLPGFPDNLSLDPRGFFWVGLVIERSRTLDRLHPHPFLMKILPRLPESWLPQPRPFGWLLAIDPDGRIVHNLQDSTGRVARVTGARRHGDSLYLTSLGRQGLSKLTLPPPARLSRGVREWRH